MNFQKFDETDFSMQFETPNTTLSELVLPRQTQNFKKIVLPYVLHMTEAHKSVMDEPHSYLASAKAADVIIRYRKRLQACVRANNGHFKHLS